MSQQQEKNSSPSFADICMCDHPFGSHSVAGQHVCLISDCGCVKFNLVGVDLVNHPPHYNQGKYEVIAVIEDWKLPYHLGNATKYIARAGKKDPTKTTEDLEKAIWYIRRYIDEICTNQQPGGSETP